MYKYKLMIIDDEIENRIEYLSLFFTNKIIDDNKEISNDVKKAYKKEIGIEFDICYPQTHEILDEYIKNNKVDAYFLDVYLEEAPSWNLSRVLSAIKSYNFKAPIFVYSTSWRDREAINDITKEFKYSWPGKTPTYFYELNTIHDMVINLSEDISEPKLTPLRHERNFIKDVIVEAYGKTKKMPFSKEGDVVILHISDIQYGDENTDKYNASIWAQVVENCTNLKNNGVIAGVDLLAITGDVSMHGKSEEMDAIGDEIENLLFHKLWNNEFESKAYKERILLVPGNHDFDLNFCTLDYLISENGPQKEDRKIDFAKASESLQDGKRMQISNRYRDMGLNAFKDFAYNLTGNPIFYQSKHLNYVDERFTSWNLRIVCLNTCDGISASKTNGVAINKEEYKDIINKNCADSCCTIVLSHHSPLFSNELSENEKETFEVQCTDIVKQCHANVWLGGHRHVHETGMETTAIQQTKVYEASTISLKEEWENEPPYIVTTVAKKRVESRRGFQIIILKQQSDGTYSSEVIVYVFDEQGVALRVEK